MSVCKKGNACLQDDPRPHISMQSYRPLFTGAHYRGDKRENKLSAGWVHHPLYILHITTEGTMCLRWQVAIVHNVLMLTKCQFDPWDWWVGRGCGSWILKQATVWCSCGDGRRHDTDETGNYLPNGRQIQGRKSQGEGKRDEERERQHAGQMKGWISHLKKAQRQIPHLSVCVICLHRPVTLKLMYCIRPTNGKCLRAVLFKGSPSSWCRIFECTAEAEALHHKNSLFI